MNLMRLSVLTRDDGVTVVKVRGEADLATSPDLTTGLSDLDVPPGGVVLLDLSLLDFCDASGLNAMVRAARNLGTRGVELALARPQPHMVRLLQDTGLDEYFEVFSTLAAVGWRRQDEEGRRGPRVAPPGQREADGSDAYGGAGKAEL